MPKRLHILFPTAIYPLIFVGTFALLFVFNSEPVVAQALPPVETSHFSGYKQQQPDGYMTCEGYSTNLTSQNYQVDIKYKGDPNCCGAQTDGDGIWIGGNDATNIGVDFIRDQNRLQFKNLGPFFQIGATVDGQWHTYSITKVGTVATISLDGHIIRTGSASPTAPSVIALGGKCTSPNLYNWNNFWYDITFYNVTSCTVNTTSASVATNSNPNDWRSDYGNILPGQTTTYFKGNNSVGILKGLSENLNNWSQTPAVNNSAYPVDIFGWKVGTHTLTAAGGGENYCPTTGTATFNCINQPPSITPVSPKDIVGLPPSDYVWSGSYSGSRDFGMDSCGGNADTADDNLTVTLFDSPNCTGTVLDGSAQCNYQGTSASAIDPVSHQASCPNRYTFPSTPHTYSWRLTAKNGPDPVDNKKTVCTNFTYQPAAKAWWQADSGHVYGAGGVKSPISCSGSTCRFNLATLGSPGVVVYNTGSADFGQPGNLSQTGWLAGGAPYLARVPLYDELYRQLPSAPITISVVLDQPTLSSLTNSGPAADAYYLEYSGTAALNLGNLNVGDKKVVVLAGNATEVHLNGDISVNHGRGFFAVVTTAPVKISAGVRNLDTLIFTENSVYTGTSGTDDVPLLVDGMVIAEGNVYLQRDLDRSGATGQNNLKPAEKFTFAPDYLFVLPRGLRRFQYQLNETAPSGPGL